MFSMQLLNALAQLGHLCMVFIFLFSKKTITYLNFFIKFVISFGIRLKELFIFIPCFLGKIAIFLALFFEK